MKHLKLFEDYWENLYNKTLSKKKDRLIQIILNRGNLMYNIYDKIILEDGIIKIKMQYSNLLGKRGYVDYWIDTKNKKLIDKNTLGETYDLSDEELDKLENRLYFYIKKSN